MKYTKFTMLNTIVETDDIVKYYIDSLNNNKNLTLKKKKDKFFMYLFGEFMNVTSMNWLEVTLFEILEDMDNHKKYQFRLSNTSMDDKYLLNLDFVIEIFKQDKETIDEVIQVTTDSMMKDQYNLMKQTGLFYPKSGYITFIQFIEEMKSGTSISKSFMENILYQNQQYLEIKTGDVMNYKEQVNFIELFQDLKTKTQDYYRYDLDEFTINFNKLMSTIENLFNQKIIH